MSSSLSEAARPPQAVLGPQENFMGIDDPAFSSFESSAFVIQSVPFEKTSSYRQGSAAGPAAILKASHYVEYYDEVLGREPFREVGICTLAPLEVTGDGEAAVRQIEEATARLLAANKRVISLGAEHTVTLGFAKAHAAHYPGLTVLQLDAHSDLRASYHGTPYSHASVMARINELGLNICQVGIRAQCREEADLIRSSPNIHTFYAHQIRKNPDWMSEAVSCLTDKVYLTIDADGFDPSVVPAVGTPEPGGLYWEETVAFLAKVAASKEIVGFDVVELAPEGGETRSPYLLAKLVYRLIGLITGARS